MITRHQFKSVWGLPNASPFCMKTETYLRMAGLPYEVRVSDPRKAPKQKLPYIEEDGVRICDSAAIVQHLKQKHGDKLDAGLTEQQLALGHVIRRTCEEGLYWVLVYSRWGEEDGFALVERDLLRPALPALVRSFLPGVIRKGVMKQAHAQGTGRHTREEIYELGKADLQALSSLLGTQDFFLGQNPTRTLETFPNLVAYCKRMKARYYADASA
jgi:glutathione S-transferase